MTKTVVAAVLPQASLCTDELFHQFIADAQDILDNDFTRVLMTRTWDAIESPYMELEDLIDYLAVLCDRASIELKNAGFTVSWSDGSYTIYKEG